MPSTSQPILQPLLPPVFVYNLFMRDEARREPIRIGAFLPCRLDEAIWLASVSSMSREERVNVTIPDYLKGLRDVFHVAEGALWYGHVMLRLDRIISGAVYIQEAIQGREQYLARIGWDEGMTEHPWWLMHGISIEGRKFLMPFFGPIRERRLVNDSAFWQWGDLDFVNGNVFNRRELLHYQMMQISLKDWTQLQNPEHAQERDD